jgi:hypothetical protein
MLLGSGKVYYQDAKLGVDLEVPAAYLVPMGSGPVIVDFEHATETDLTDKDVDRDPAPGARFADLPAAASKAKSYDEWKKGFADLLFRSHKLALLRSESLEALSKPGESEADFRARLQLLARERRDAAAEKLRVKYAPKLATLTDRLRRAQQATAKQKEQRAAAGLGAAVSFGTALLGAFMGRKVASAGNISKAASAVRSASRTVQESGDVARAEETAEAIEKQIADIQSQFNAEVEAITSRLDPAREELVAVALKPKKANISVRAVLLAWAPYEGDTEAW